MTDTRLLILKFYADQPNLGIINKLFVFRVENPEKAMRIIARFEAQDIDTKIRAAFLNPSYGKLRSTMGIRFEYHDHPTYLYLKGSY